MNKYIEETVYAIYSTTNCGSICKYMIAPEIEEAIEMFRDKYKGYEITRVEKLCEAYRRSTKTITVNV